MGCFAVKMNKHWANIKSCIVVVSVLLVQAVFFGLSEKQDAIAIDFTETEHADYFGSPKSSQLPGDVINVVIPSVSNFTFSSLKKVDYSGPFSFFYHRNQILVTKLISGFFEGSVSIHQLILNHLYPFFFFF